MIIKIYYPGLKKLLIIWGTNETSIYNYIFFFRTHDFVILIYAGGSPVIKKLKMDILLWIQGLSGQLNSWAWTKWDKLHREDWLKGYKKWKDEKK